jgi:hypothetical protein
VEVDRFPVEFLIERIGVEALGDPVIDPVGPESILVRLASRRSGGALLVLKG